MQADKITTLTAAASVEVEPIWATLLAKALEGKNVKDLLSNVGAGGGAPAVGAPAASGGGGGGGGGGGAAPAAEAKKEEKAEEKEESDDDMVNSTPVQPATRLLIRAFAGLRAFRLTLLHILILSRITYISCALRPCAHAIKQNGNHALPSVPPDRNFTYQS